MTTRDRRLGALEQASPRVVHREPGTTIGDLLVRMKVEITEWTSESVRPYLDALTEKELNWLAADLELRLAQPKE